MINEAMIDSPLGVYKIFGITTTELLAIVGIVTIMTFVIIGIIQLIIKCIE